MKVLWKAPDGREFVFLGKDIDAIKAKIAIKRKELGFPEPQAMVALTNDTSNLQGKTPCLDFHNDLNEEQQKAILEEIEKMKESTNNKKLN